MKSHPKPKCERGFRFQFSVVLDRRLAMARMAAPSTHDQESVWMADTKAVWVLIAKNVGIPFGQQDVDDGGCGGGCCQQCRPWQKSHRKSRLRKRTMVWTLGRNLVS